MSTSKSKNVAFVLRMPRRSLVRRRVIPLSSVVCPLSSVLCPLSADLYCYVRAAENSHRQGPEVCPSRQARDFEAVTGQLLIAISDAGYAAGVFGINVE